MLTNFFKSKNVSESAIDTMEEEIDQMITMNLSAPPLDPSSGGESPDDDFAFPSLRLPAVQTPDSSDEHRLTSYSQTRLAGLTAFQDMQLDVADDLQSISAALARIDAASSRTRDFISSTHASIHRANEIELGNAALLSENRKLQQQVEQVKRLKSQHETLVETFRRKEARHEEEAGTLKAELDTARQELDQLHAEVAALETERAGLLGELSSKSSQAERYGRENELLREKQVSLNHDLENAERRSREMERKSDEIGAINSTLSSQLSDLRVRFSASEKEALRLQKQLDAANANLAETRDALPALEQEHDEVIKRHSAVVQKMKGEAETLRARAEVAARAQAQASDEIGDLKQKLATSESEKRLALERLAMAKSELDAKRSQQAPVATKASETGLLGETASKALDARNQEIEELKRELKAQKDEVRRLSLLERVQKDFGKVGPVPQAKAAE